MGDVLDTGPEPARRRWLVPTALVAAAAAVGLVVVRPGGSPAPDDGRPDRTPAATTSSSADGGPTGAAPGTLQPWPSAPGACGGETFLPLLSVGRLRETTGLTVLVGGAGLRVVDVDTGATRRVTVGRSAQVIDLASSAAGVHALRLRCGRPRRPAGRALTVRLPERTSVPALPGRVDALLDAPDTGWGYRYPADPDEAIVLHPLDGGPAARLAAGFSPAVATKREVLGTVARAADQPDGAAFYGAAVPRDDPTRVRRLGTDAVLAAAGGRALTTHQCDPVGGCDLAWGRPGGDGRRTFSIPAGRAVTSEVVLDPGGRQAAFLLARADLDRRYDPGHPGVPSDVAVLDLRSGTLSVVPGVELAPKSSAGLAFSSSGRWLLIGLDEGRRARLLAWRPGLGRAVASPARLPGRVLYGVPVLDVTGRAGARR